MFDAWLSAAMLTLECIAVVNLRLMKIGGGGSGAYAEASLMIEEKIAAAVEAQSALWSGKSTFSVIERYREHVAANTKRLAV